MKNEIQKISGLATAVKVLLIIWMSFAGIAGLLFGASLLWMNDLELYATVSSFGALFFVVSSLFLVATGIVFFVWLGKATNNAAHISKNEKKFSVSWNIIGYFIPFVNFIAPYASMRDVWQVTSQENSEEKENIIIWWVTFIIFGLLAKLGDYIDDPALEYLSIETTTAYFLSIITGFVAAIFLIRTMEMISKAQEKKI